MWRIYVLKGAPKVHGCCQGSAGAVATNRRQPGTNSDWTPPLRVPLHQRGIRFRANAYLYVCLAADLCLNGSYDLAQFKQKPLDLCETCCPTRSNKALSLISKRLLVPRSASRCSRLATGGLINRQPPKLSQSLQALRHMAPQQAVLQTAGRRRSKPGKKKASGGDETLLLLFGDALVTALWVLISSLFAEVGV